MVSLTIQLTSTLRSFKVVFCYLGSFMTHGGILSSAGLFKPIPGCRGTACHAWGLGTPLHGPSGVDRDDFDPKGVPQWCFATFGVS